MCSESVRKSNNGGSSLGEWLNSTVEMPKNPFNAVLWPKDYESARSIADETDIHFVTAIDDSDTSKHLNRHPDIVQKEMLSYKLAEDNPGAADLEYSYGVADDVIRRGPREGLTAEEGIEQVLETSDKMLKPGGISVYNMKSGTREELPYDSQMEFARAFEEILRDSYDIEPEIYETPEMRDPNSHFVWKKPVE